MNRLKCIPIPNRRNTVMAKKTNDDVPNPNSVVNRDIIQRLNFLYQASVYLSSCNPPKSPRLVSTRDLAKDYISTMRAVGKRTTVRMYVLSSRSRLIRLDQEHRRDPAVKRTLCKGCNITLIPGATATVRIKSLWQIHLSLSLLFTHLQNPHHMETPYCTPAPTAKQ